MTDSIIKGAPDEVVQAYKKINAQRKQFIEYYLETSNGRQSAIKAGYAEASSDVQAAKIMKCPKVKLVIDWAMAQACEEVGATAEYVIENITKVVERCMQREPVLNSKGEHQLTELEDGSEALAYTFNANGALKGLELLGKHHKLFTDVTEVRDERVNKSDLDEALKALADVGLDEKVLESVTSQVH